MERISPVTEIEERVAKALCDAEIALGTWPCDVGHYTHMARAAIEAFGHAQCSREQVIKECAALCDGLRRKDYTAENEDWIAGTSDCATAIRALSDTSTDGKPCVVHNVVVGPDGVERCQTCGHDIMRVTSISSPAREAGK